MKRGKDWLIGYLIGVLRGISWRSDVTNAVKGNIEQALKEAEKELQEKDEA